MVEVRVVATAGLGDRSYVVTDGDVAVVIDPQRDIDRTLDAAADATITHVFETPHPQRLRDQRPRPGAPL